MIISIVIPVYRSEASIERVYRDTRDALIKQGWEYEFVFVEDCGGDNSWQVIKQIAEQDPNVIGLQLSRNFGQHNALLCALNQVKGDVIVTMDDDGQHPAEEIKPLLDELNKGYDVVYGTPKKQPHGVSRALASKITKLVLQRAMGAETAQKVSAFRAIKRDILGVFQEYSGSNVNIDVMLTWASKSFSSVEVNHKKRAEGESGYTFRVLVEHSMNMMTGFSTLPLQFASYLGFLFSGLGFLSLIYILLTLIIKGTLVPGFAFIASIISIFAGVQLLTIGIIGEYVGRIHSNSLARPAYIVKQQTAGTLDDG